MSRTTIEERIAILEREMAYLKTTVVNGARSKDWRRTIGVFTDDPNMREIFKEALKLREADRARARRQYGKRRRTAS